MAETPRTPGPPCRWLLLSVASVCLAGCEQPPARRPAPAPNYDANYLAALAVADEFCEAWRRRDVPAGKALLSLRAKRTYPDARIHDAIAGSTSPLHAAFELHSGRREPDGALAFRLTLHYRFLGRAQERIETRRDRIVLRRDEAGRWRVDGFPLLSGP